MKGNFRQSMSWLHTYSGLLVGWVLFLVFAAGTAAYWRAEITQWMQPELHGAPPARTTPEAQARQLQNAVRWLEQNAADSTRWFITLPSAREPKFQIFAVVMRPDPKTGRPFTFSELSLSADGTPWPEGQAPRATRGGDFLYRLHFDLHYMSPLAARWIVGFCAMFMLVAIVSGIVTHKRIFADFFTFRPRKGQRSWLDAHNATAVLALPYHLMITYTGLCTLMFMYYPMITPAAYGKAGDAAYQAEAFGRPPPARPAKGAAAPQAAPMADAAAMMLDAHRRWRAAGAPDGVAAERVVVEGPGTAAATLTVSQASAGSGGMSLHAPSLQYRAATGEFASASPAAAAAVHTHGVMEGLHTARFASPLLRWLFFASGLMGCAMVATGVLLWAVKERPQHLKALKKGERGTPALRLVDGLNVGAVAGLLLALPAYFWANRLLPVGMDGRAQAEINAFFAVWALAFAWGLLRPTLGVWRAQLWLAAALFALLPLLNVATGGAHWGRSVSAGQWAVAGFDAVCLLLGAGLAAAAAWVGKKQAASAGKATDKGIGKGVGKVAGKVAGKGVAKPAPAPVPTPAHAEADAPADRAAAAPVDAPVVASASASVQDAAAAASAQGAPAPVRAPAKPLTESP